MMMPLLATKFGMKHDIIISVGIILGSFFLSKSGATGEEANLYVIRYIDVDRVNAKKFEKAVAEKTKKFNRSEDSDQWFTHKIVTGPRTGQYARWFGPKTWADLDNPESSHRITLGATASHKEAVYWQKNILPLEKEAGNNEVWMVVPGTSFSNFSKDQPRKYEAIYRWKMKPGMYQRKTAQDVKLTKAIQASEFKIQGHIARLVSGGDYMTFANAIAFNSWEEYGKFRAWEGMGDVFDKVHGKGSWKKFLIEHNAIMQEGGETEGEFWEYLEDLSSLELSK